MDRLAEFDLPDVSRETLEKLQIYVELLEKWNRKINLVAPDTVRDASRRHIKDSAQVLTLVKAPPQSWVDLGSGGGFPGLVVAICAAGLGWPTQVTLIESDQRKCAFLRNVSRETQTPVSVVTDRIEAVAPQAAAVVSARALAPLPRLLPWVQRHLAEDGHALLLKGRSYKQELEETRDKFAFSLEIHPSHTDSEAVILEIGDIRDV